MAMNDELIAATLAAAVVTANPTVGSMQPEEKIKFAFQQWRAVMEELRDFRVEEGAAAAAMRNTPDASFEAAAPEHHAAE
jgi:hypothetical protein